MAHAYFDRVKETSTTTGTGNITLGGAASGGFRTFSSVYANADTMYYCIQDQSGNDWEVGRGTYNSSGTTLSRTSVLASSNSNSAVNFTSGSLHVFVIIPAAVMPANSSLALSPLSGILTMSYNVATVSSAATNYFSLGGGTAAGNATEANRQTMVPIAGTARNLYVATSSTQSAGGSLVFTVRKNGADTALTLTIPASTAAGTFSDTTNSFSVAAGDKLSLKVANGTGTSAAIISATVGIY
jgi:uncharacterized cupredoxin-like copper-binding protein